MSLRLDEEIRWLFDRYVILLNHKLKSTGRSAVAPTRIAEAVLTKFLLENQEGILREYDEIAVQHAEQKLPELGYVEASRDGFRAFYSGNPKEGEKDGAVSDNAAGGPKSTPGVRGKKNRHAGYNGPAARISGGNAFLGKLTP